MTSDPRQTPSGKWQGIAKHPSGTRATKVFPLKMQARKWAADTEADWRRVGFRDPRAGKITAAAWHAKWVVARARTKSTMKDNEQVWRLHVEPRWGTWPLDSITRMEVQGWAGKMLAAGTGIRTVQKSVSLLSMLLQAALDEDPPILAHGRNPCRGVVAGLPPAPVRPPTYYTVEQYRAILARIEHEPWRTLVDLGFVAGLRWGELGGLLVRNVDLLHKLLHVQVVLERDGTLREHPKSKRSNRAVPIPPHLLKPLGALMLGKRKDDPVFARADLPVPTALDIDRLTAVWNRAVARARTCPEKAPKCGGPTVCREAEHRVPEYSPHSMRHSAASWLVMAGVDLYRVQALLGHESYLTTQRYAHLAPSAHDSAREVWAGIFGADSTHEAKGGASVEDPSGANVQVKGVRPAGIEPATNGLEDR